MKNRIIVLVVGIVLVLLTTILFQSCTKRWEEEEVKYRAANWTNEGKIVFVEERILWIHEETLLGYRTWEEEKNIWLCEINDDGTGKERIENVFNDVLRSVVSTSSTGDYVVMGEDQHREIWAIRRDGTGLQKAGDGTNPDFSPDAEKIAYQKQDEGIWIMNRDGSGNYQIILDGRSPAWSSDGAKIAFVAEQLFVADTSGAIIDSLGEMIISPDWSLSVMDTLMACLTHPQRILTISLNPVTIDTLNIPGSLYVRWAPNGQKIISSDNNGIYISNIDGTSKWYLRP